MSDAAAAPASCFCNASSAMPAMAQTMATSTRALMRACRKTRDNSATAAGSAAITTPAATAEVKRHAVEHADREQEVAEKALPEQQHPVAARQGRVTGAPARPRQHRNGGDAEAQPGQQEDREGRHQQLRQADVAADHGHAGRQAGVGPPRRQRGGRQRPAAAMRAVTGRGMASAVIGRPLGRGGDLRALQRDEFARQRVAECDPDHLVGSECIERFGQAARQRLQAALGTLRFAQVEQVVAALGRRFELAVDAVQARPPPAPR